MAGYAQGEQADVDGIDRALECLDQAESHLKIVRAHEVAERDEESGEDTPRSKQPDNLRDAAKEARRVFAKARGEKPRY